MDRSDEAKPPTAAKECVKVAVNIRPLISNELLLGCTNCITVVPGLPQTGSGKTYTMGTNYKGEDSCGGIIPQVVQIIFRKVDSLKETTEFLVRVSFIEIFNERVYDLLDPNANASLRAKAGSSLAKTAIPSRVPIEIREMSTGVITLAGVTEAEIHSKEEMASYLIRGSLARATRSTNMNSQSRPAQRRSVAPSEDALNELIREVAEKGQRKGGWWRHLRTHLTSSSEKWQRKVPCILHPKPEYY